MLFRSICMDLLVPGWNLVHFRHLCYKIRGSTHIWKILVEGRPQRGLHDLDSLATDNAMLA